MNLREVSGEDELEEAKQEDWLSGDSIKPDVVVIGALHQIFPAFFLLGVQYDCTLRLPMRLGVAV